MLFTRFAVTNKSAVFTTTSLLFLAHSHCLKCVKILLVSFPAFLQEEEFSWETFCIPGKSRASTFFALASTTFCFLLLTNSLLTGNGVWGGLELCVAHPVEKICPTVPELHTKQT